MEHLKASLFANVSFSFQMDPRTLLTQADDSSLFNQLYEFMGLSTSILHVYWSPYTSRYHMTKDDKIRGCCCEKRK